MFIDICTGALPGFQSDFFSYFLFLGEIRQYLPKVHDTVAQITFDVLSFMILY